MSLLVKIILSASLLFVALTCFLVAAMYFYNARREFQRDLITTLVKNHWDLMWVSAGQHQWEWGIFDDHSRMLARHENWETAIEQAVARFADSELEGPQSESVLGA